MLFSAQYASAMNETPCTPEDRQRIVLAAMKRADYLQWLAKALLRTDDILIRREASVEILKLFGECHGEDC